MRTESSGPLLAQLKNGRSLLSPMAGLHVSPLHMIGKALCMDSLTPDDRPDNIHLGKGIKFCLNCDNMDDLAFDDENRDKDVVLKRFQNCQRTGKFEGDICSRMYVVNENEYNDGLFTDAENDDK